MNKYNKGKKMRRIAVGVIITISLFTTACGRSVVVTTDGTKSAKDSVSENLQKKVHEYGAQISIKDIKNKYEYTDDTLMPLYNVNQEESFKFKISNKLAAFIKKDSIKDIVTVHTDYRCLDKSEILIDNVIDSKEKYSVMNIVPKEVVLPNDMQTEENTDNKPMWGNAPMYYLAIHYDLNSNKLDKLIQPIIIPFTIRQEVNPPYVKTVIDNQGCLKLTWDKVEGAEKYNIYQATATNAKARKKNKALKNSEKAYRDTYKKWICSTTETEYSEFDHKKDGLKISRDVLVNDYFVDEQNSGVEGDYYVSAVVGGRESGFVQAVATSELMIPKHIDEETKEYLDETTIERIEDLPLTMDVVNVDGSISSRNVLYTYKPYASYNYMNEIAYVYQIEGTALSGTVTVAKTQQNYPESVGAFKNNGNSRPQNNIQKFPDKSLNNELNQNSEEDGESLLERLKRNTREHVQKGNEGMVKNPNNGEIIFGDSAEEEWLALNLINAEQSISVEAFPKLQDPNMLEDVFNKVYNQNPYIIGVYGFDYDYEKMTLNVEYLYDQDTIYQKQQELFKEGAKITNDIIKENMSDDEKRLAIYQYLENNCTYDNEAVAQCEVNGYVKTKDSTYEDSFNAYGIIVKKKGVCQSYSYAFKLLCSFCGVESRVITGVLNGSYPHSWNVVKIEGDWFQIDCTNNGIYTGIPYFLYNADTITAKETGYISDKLYELDSNLSEFEVDNSHYEYYHTIDCVADSVKSYQEVLDKVLENNTEFVCVRYTGSKPNKDELIKVVKEEYNKHGIEDGLSQMKYSDQNGYITLKK